MNTQKDSNKNGLSTKTYRIMAQMLAGTLITSTLACVTTAAITNGKKSEYKSLLDESTATKQNVIAEYKSTYEYAELFNSIYSKITEEYTTGLISFDQYLEKLNYLKTNDFTENLIKNNNAKINTEIQGLDNLIKSANTNYEKYSNINEITAAVSVFSAPLSILSPVLAYQFKKEEQEEINEDNQNTL